MTNLFPFGNENIELLRKWESPLVCSLASKQTFYPKTGSWLSKSILLLETSLERKELTTVDIWKGHNNNASATIIRYSKPWFILENAHMLYFFINYCVRTSAKQIISGVVDRKKTTVKYANNKTRAKTKKMPFLLIIMQMLTFGLPSFSCVCPGFIPIFMGQQVLFQ